MKNFLYYYTKNKDKKYIRHLILGSSCKTFLDTEDKNLALCFDKFNDACFFGDFLEKIFGVKCEVE